MGSFLEVSKIYLKGPLLYQCSCLALLGDSHPVSWRPCGGRYVMGGDVVAYYISLPTGFDDGDQETRIEYLDRSADATHDLNL
jgi:hypothetical protein